MNHNYPETLFRHSTVITIYSPQTEWHLTVKCGTITTVDQCGVYAKEVNTNILDPSKGDTYMGYNSTQITKLCIIHCVNTKNATAYKMYQLN